VRILIVEDDALLVTASRAACARWVRRRLVPHRRGGRPRGGRGPYDAIVLDLGLPGKSGSRCSPLAVARPDGPRADTHRTRGAGEPRRRARRRADDYLVKPIALQELAARVRAITRRARGGPRRCGARRARIPAGGAGGDVARRTGRVDRAGGDAARALPRQSQPGALQAADPGQALRLGEELESNALEVYVTTCAARSRRASCAPCAASATRSVRRTRRSRARDAAAPAARAAAGRRARDLGDRGDGERVARAPGDQRALRQRADPARAAGDAHRAVVRCRDDACAPRCDRAYRVRRGADEGAIGSAELMDMAIAAWSAGGELRVADGDGTLLPFRAGRRVSSRWRSTASRGSSTTSTPRAAPGSSRSGRRPTSATKSPGAARRPVPAWVLMLPVLLVAMAVVVRHALRPVRRLAEDIGARGADDLHPVAVSGLPAELAPLVQATNRLFDRFRHTLEHERRLTADAAHELRTPLAALRAQWEAMRVAATMRRGRRRSARSARASTASRTCWRNCLRCPASTTARRRTSPRWWTGAARCRMRSPTACR